MTQNFRLPSPAKPIQNRTPLPPNQTMQVARPVPINDKFASWLRKVETNAQTPAVFVRLAWHCGGRVFFFLRGEHKKHETYENWIVSKLKDGGWTKKESKTATWHMSHNLLGPINWTCSLSIL